MRAFLFIPIQSMHRLIIEHIIRSLILEVQSHTRKVRDEVVALDPSNIKPAPRINRIYAPGLSTGELIDMIKEKYNTDVESIPPKKEGSLSSKFPTLRFKAYGEDVSIIHAKGIIAGAEGEGRQASSINDQLQGQVVILKVGNIEKEVDGFRKVLGNKKADFAFTYKGKDVIYIQHKSPIHQQMSGTVKFDRDKYPILNAFIEEVKKLVDNSPDQKLSTPVYTDIGSSDDMNQFKVDAVYGDQDDSENGVQVYAVGNLKLVDDNGVKRLEADEIFVYPEIPTGPNTPVLGATYRSDRNQYGIPNVRFGVYPVSYLKNANKL